MHGYPRFYFWILKALLSPHSFKPQKCPCISRHHPKETQVSRDAQNVCAVTRVDTVLKTAAYLLSLE